MNEEHGEAIQSQLVENKRLVEELEIILEF